MVGMNQANPFPIVSMPFTSLDPFNKGIKVGYDFNNNDGDNFFKMRYEMNLEREKLKHDFSRKGGGEGDLE